ncbi:MAG: restriction endonuclease subunit S [Cyclobacteriaceae bacterium]|nr:restriction endonuclease subunit S [Cyclobacteriaceae bacterium]
MTDAFKQSVIGPIPLEWKVARFEEIFNIIKSYSLSRDKLTMEATSSEVHNIHYGDIHSKFVGNHLDFDIELVPFIKDEFLTEKENQFLENGDIVIADVSEDLIDIGKCVELKNVKKRKIIGGLHTIVARDKGNNIEKGFGAYIFKHDEVIKELRSMATGMSVYGISKGNLNKLPIPIPSSSEQRKIAYILSTIQKAIEQQDKLIRQTTELKKALMQRLFTEGTKSEKQKQTEIGLVPQSWEVAKIGSMYDFTGKPRGLEIVSPTPFIPMELVPISQRFIETYELRQQVSSGTYVENGDLLVAKITPSFENGKQGFVSIDKEYAYATTEVIPMKGKVEISDLHFLYYYLLKDDVRKQLADKMEGSTGRQRLSKTVLGETLIPKPPIEEQIEVASTFIALDKKVSFCENKKRILSDLFKTLLHELMTGQRRVHEIDFPGMTKEYALKEVPLSMAAER